MLTNHCSRNKEAIMTRGQWQDREAGEQVREGSGHKNTQEIVGHVADREVRVQ